MKVVAEPQVKKMLSCDTKSLTTELGGEKAVRDVVVVASESLTSALEKMEGMLSMLEKIHQAQKMA